MHLWFKGCAKTHAGNTIRPINTFCRAGIKGDFSGLVSHRHNVVVVHHETCRGVTAEVNLKNKNTHLLTLQSFLILLSMNVKTWTQTNNHLNKQLVKCRAEWAREVGILNGMKDLRLVYVTAEGMANSGVSKGA